MAAARYTVLGRAAPCLPGIMVWVCKHTESLLLAQRLHACYAGSMLWKKSFATALWVIAGLVAGTHRKTLM